MGRCGHVAYGSSLTIMSLSRKYATVFEERGQSATLMYSTKGEKWIKDL